MAEIVLSAFLQVLFDRVASHAVSDFFEAKKLDDELLTKMKTTLLGLNKVLDDAEMKQITNENVKKWLEELQDAVYDAEDLWDEVNTKAMKRQLEKETRSSSSRLLSIHKKLKAPFESLSMQAKLKKILLRLEEFVKQKDLLGLQEGVAEKPYEKTSLPDEHIVYGRNEDRDSILKLLLAESNDSVDVISITGMGGIGKTTLAQLVYNDGQIVQNFNFKAWVCISEGFDVKEVTRTILQAVTSSISVPEDLNLMQEQLKKNLVGKKFLVVLDDVWNENRDHWDLLKKPLQYGLRGSKILVTTRNQGVAQIMRTVPTHSLEKLSDEDCWELFAKYAFEGGETQPDQRFREMGREIVKKCGGLPLAAKALGGLLRHKKTIEEWSKIMESNVWDLEDKKCNILPVLRVSYHYLSPRLKRCFAFASIFPKDYEFRRDELILMWAAQSFLPQGKKVEDIGGEYFNELVSRSFFQRSTSHSSLFVMHDLMHDLATFVSGQSCLCGVNLEDRQEITKTTRHMSYFKMSGVQLIVLLTTNTLRTFAQLNDFWISPPKLRRKEISYLLLTVFKSLRVLSLPQYEIEVLPDTIGNLKHLRHLDLSRTKIKSLPNSICDLYNLQSLILTDCLALIELPTHMCKLVNLQYLDVTGCYALRKMPRNLGKLKNLARLGRFNVGKDINGANIGELGQLSNLGGELSISGLQNVGSAADAAAARLKDKKYLEKLELSWNSEEDGPRKDYEVLEKLQPHRSLKELTIDRYMGKRFPNWIEDQMYSNMVSLKLRRCKHCPSIPTLGQLPSLKELYITGFASLERLDSEFYGNNYAAKPFGSLEILCIEFMPQWKEWFHRDGEAFPLLRELHLKNCPEFRGNLPAHLPSLTNLRFEGCRDFAGSLPEAPALSYLRLENSNEMLLNHLPQGLKKLKICRFYHLTSLPPAAFSSTLKSLEILSIKEMPLLEEWFHKDDEAFPLLRKLQLINCPKLRGNLPAHLPSLINLEINECPDLAVSLPEAPALSDLKIIKSKKFLGLSDGGLPSRLTSLEVSGCGKFMEEILDRGLHGLNSLTKLTIQDWEGVVSFPPEGLLPKSLRILSIALFDDLETLEHKGLKHLTSLSDLDVWTCPKLKCIPPEGLPASLSDLGIYNCALLTPRLEEDGGEDWDKIAHIPNVYIL